MPPARKKGGINSINNNNNNNTNFNNNNSSSKKVKSVTELQLGDLVLAKVKGFPAWPAKVSRPEDWDRTPDPKKYFVQFFGTREIAFVAPADIQAFTSESKAKLLARCKGKTVKYFAQAVKEIFEASEELQTHSDIRGALRPAGKVKDGKINGSYVESTKVLKFGESCQSDDALDHAVRIKEETCQSPATEDEQAAAVKDSIGDREENIKRKKESNGLSLVQDEALSTSPSLFSPNNEGTTLYENKNHSPYRECSIGVKETSMPLEGSGHLKFSSGEDKKLANRDMSKDIKVGAKRKADGTPNHANDAKSSGHFGDGTLGKVSAGGHAKRLASDLNKFEVNTQGKVSKNLHKCPKLSDVAKNSPQKLVTNAEGHVGSGNPRQTTGQAGNDQSLSVKKAKLVDMTSDAPKGSALKNGKSNLEAEMLDEEAVPLVVKRRHHATGVGSYNGKRIAGVSSKNDVLKKRRSVQLCDDDDADDEPKTPVHGGSIKSASFSDSVKNNENSESFAGHLTGDGSKKDHQPSAKLVGETSSLPLKVDSSAKANVASSPGSEALEKRLVKESKTDLISPTKSPQVAALKKTFDQQKPNRLVTKVTNSVSHSKAQAVSIKDPTSASGGSNSSLSQIPAQKGKQSFSGERARIAAKTGVKLTESAASLDNHKEHDSEFKGRDKSGSLTDSKATDTGNSIKNLIAQAKMRQTRKQSIPPSGGDSVIAPIGNLVARSPSPSPSSHAFHSGGVNVTQLEAPVVESRGSLASPSACAPQLVSEESEEKGFSLVHNSGGSTLSGGTEAAVARDAFEGMIETLSRTKESIGRATRLAIDCAKYGIANEVVDLLIRKLENESSFHRRVDLFFLVDSITQCSHGQKGVAGASYLPTIQAALPRLLGAAAPPGSNARENRRQCLKVLRLWLERKILPESVLRRFMDDIGGSNDATSSGLSFKRPSRAERSVDDPIRGMEGMLVDEYGSNATFNLPGFLTTRGFVDDEEDEDDVPTSPHNQSEASPLQSSIDASIRPETEGLTPNDRRHHILEDVDGELEMEDATGHQKDGALSPYNFSKNDEQKMELDAETEPSTGDVVESPILNGSPPLPLESPPPLPPLPSSPPPPPPPPLSPSPPPPPPPPSTLLSQPPLPPLLPPGPPQAGSLQPLAPLQPLVTAQVALPQTAISSVQGVHAVQMAGNTSQPGPCFVPGAASNSRPLEYRQNEMYPGQLTGPSNQQFQQHQQFQPSQATFTQRAFAPVSLPQPPLGPFAYNKPPVQQHMPHPHSHLPAFPPAPTHPYPASNLEGVRRFGDEQWRSAPPEYKAESHHNTWVNGERTQSCPATTFIGEVYYRPPERAPSDNLGRHASAPNSAFGGPSSSGHGINQMLPSRPDMLSLNCWRPA
ncbi:hypothetical protein RND81_09G194900 [Saponaria officinalis]|uniref:ENHANCER OF AG-4 protein 2 n=2 Tax=Saponaria officinalis TaxID=3572 RepID=A0AAW1INI5_SAPOF